MIAEGLPEWGWQNWAKWLGLDPDTNEGIERGAATEMRYAWIALKENAIEKRVLECERDVREVARQSLTTTRAISVGETVSRPDVTIKRPGTGIEPFRLDEVVGRKLARAVDADMPLTEKDLA